MENQSVIALFPHAKNTERLKVTRSRVENDIARGSRALSKSDILKICTAIKQGSRNPVRDELMVLTAFYHGLRVSELCSLRWQQITFKPPQIAVKRVKNGIDAVHPIFDKRLLTLLRKLHKEQGNPNQGFIFLNERGNPVSVNGFQQMFRKFSKMATGIIWNAHALRHACGTSMIDAGQPIRTVQLWLGHANIQNTIKYLHESGKQFDNVVF